MFGSAILDVAIGVIFVFMLVSIICSAIREGIEARLKTRAAYLERGIRELLHDPHATGLARRFYDHPLIFSLYSSNYKPRLDASTKPGLLATGTGLPSYIPAGNFASALLDLAARGPNPVLGDPDTPTLSLDAVRANILNIESEPVQRVMLTAIDAAQGNLDRARQNLEAWYDSGMDRVSGWYKRSTQWILFWIGLAVAVALNINTLTIADFLYHDETARAAIVARAEAAAADSTFLDRGYAAAREELDSLSQAIALPIGWAQGWGAPRPQPRWSGFWNSAFGPLLGWLLTALAATFGAPFWFDLLNKMMVIRSTVKPREKSPEEGSEDRQPKTPREPAEPSPASAPSPASGPPPAATPPPAPAPTGAAAPAAPAGAAASATTAFEDACDIPITHATLDEDLPPAEGGVA